MRAETCYTLRRKRVWVAGHRGLVGSALMRRLAREDCRLLTATRQEVDLCDPHAVLRWVEKMQPQAVFLAAAKVGGIYANDTFPADFIYQNLMIQANVIHAAWRQDVEKLMVLGSSCIYPKFAPQPIPEDALLSGPLEPTNRAYAIAKIAGIELAQSFRRQYGCDFIAVMPTNLYGPGDNFDFMNSHVVPGMMAKMHQAKQCGEPTIELWGSGTPTRELLHVDDAADGMVFLMTHYSAAEIVNLGTGIEISIRDLATAVARAVGYCGRIVYDPGKPDGTPRKIVDTKRLFGLGWRPKINLNEGLEQTYQSFLEPAAAVRGRTYVHG